MLVGMQRPQVRQLVLEPAEVERFGSIGQRDPLEKRHLGGTLLDEPFFFWALVDARMKPSSGARRDAQGFGVRWTPPIAGYFCSRS